MDGPLSGVAALAAPAPCATRLKDLAGIEGVRDNQLIGYGLVVGLAGTGDTQQTLFSPQSLANLLERMGVSVPGATIRTKDTAAVMITATLPPFAQPGVRLDVTAAAIGDALTCRAGCYCSRP
jgi:flagellar P-ring protein FlgI